MNEETKNKIKQMYANGYNPEDIAEELGLDETEVINYCCEIL